METHHQGGGDSEVRQAIGELLAEVVAYLERAAASPVVECQDSCATLRDLELRRIIKVCEAVCDVAVELNESVELGVKGERIRMLVPLLRVKKLIA